MKSSRTWLWPLAILAIGAAATFLLIKLKQPLDTQPPQALPPLVETVVVRTKPHRYRIPSQGTVAPKTQIQLTAEVEGVAHWIAPSFEPGAFVDKNEDLIRLDPRDYESALAQARASIQQSQYQLTVEKAEADVAQKEWREVGEGAAASLLLREPQIASAKSALASAQASETFAELNLARTRIAAPFNARISEKLADLGQFVRRGESVASLYATDVAEIRLPVSTDDFAFLGIPVDYDPRIDPEPPPFVEFIGSVAGEERQWRGRIVRTAGAIHERTRLIHLIAQVDDPFNLRADSKSPPLPMGLFVRAEISGRVEENAVELPRIALRNRDQVLVVNQKSQIEFRGVQVGLRYDRTVIVTSGLQSGERVVVSVLETPVDGMLVRINETNEEAEEAEEEEPAE